MEDNDKLFSLEILSYVKPTNFFGNKKERKKKITKFQMQNMLRRTSKMFEWKGLPETIPQRDMELLIQTRGVTGIIKYEDKYYSVWGGLGGEFNYNYMPTLYIVANPYLRLSKTFHIYDWKEGKKDVVIIPNDSLYTGLVPIFSYHSEILTEIQLTKRCVYIWQRLPQLLTAPDNNTKKDIDDLLKDLSDGEIASIMDKNFIKSVNSLNVANGTSHNIITQLLEAEQYQKAALFNDLGLQMNYNMKRETITSSEAQLGESALLPLCDDMLQMRQNACKELKEVFGLDISVDFSSAWKDLRKSIEVEMAINEKELQGEVQSNGEQGNYNGSNDSESKSDGVYINGDLDTDNSQTNNERETYKKAVEVVEPIIEATREVIEDIVEEVGKNEQD